MDDDKSNSQDIRERLLAPQTDGEVDRVRNSW